MPFIEESEVFSIMRGYNPWWTTGVVPRDLAKKVRRLAFYDTVRWLERRDMHRAVVLSGARRVGKTTILHQIAEKALSEWVSPREVLFVSLDHPVFKLTTLDKIIDLFRMNVSDGSSQTVILLDEIQYAPDWDRFLKVLVDRNPDFKIVATGSASTLLGERGTESGVGRWLEIKVPTLSFYEYALLKDLPRPTLPRGVAPARLTTLPPPEARNVLHACASLEPHFHRYLLQGGFPETAFMEETAAAQRLLREDVVDKVLKRDIVSLYRIRNVLELERLFIYLCLHSGGIIVKEKLAKELQIARPTVEKDLELLEFSNLIYRSNPIELAGKRNLRPLTKVYIADPALRNAVLLKGDEVLTDPDQMGTIVETTVFKHLHAFFHPEHPRIGYWRAPGTQREVDVVVALPGGSHIAVEVKYRERAEVENDSGLIAFINGNEVSGAFLVTKRLENAGPVEAAALLPGKPKPWRIPAYTFLYLLGHEEHERLKG